MINWPEILIQDIARRSCVLYIGAGVSANSKAPNGERPPTWYDFLNSALMKIQCTFVQDKIRKIIENENDYLTACEVLIKRMGEHEFHRIAREAFVTPGYRPADIHDAIYNLDSNIVITPNVDKIYDQHATKESDSTVIIKSYYEDDVFIPLRNRDITILKAHGTIDTPGKMIFSRNQYTKARYDNQMFYRILDSLALTHSFVFIGCGRNDPDIKLTLENNHFWYRGCRPHYFIAERGTIDEDIEGIMRDNYNISVISYTNSSGDHLNLSNSLKYLVEKVVIQRNEYAENQRW